MPSRVYKGVRYNNGEIPASFLKKLDGQHGSQRNLNAYLRDDAADAFNRARAEIKRKYGYDLSVRGWMRTRKQQESMFWPRVTLVPNGNPRRYYNGRTYYLRGAAVATPGWSNHGWGTTIDVSNFGGVGQWNHPNRKKFYPILKKHGFDDSEGRRINEPWHLEYMPSKDKGKKKSKGKHAKGKTRKPKRLATLRKGDRGGRTADLQRALEHTGDYHGKIDGIFGSGTESAVKGFQKRTGLEVDGVVGANTWYRLIQGLKNGHRNVRVPILKTVVGLPSIGRNGRIIGKVTENRMKQVQRWLGVNDDGVFGPKTIAALIEKG